MDPEEYSKNHLISSIAVKIIFSIFKQSSCLKFALFQYARRNAEAAEVKAVTIEMHGNGVSASDQNCSMFTVSHSDNMIIRTAKHAFCIVDHFG